MLNRKDADFHPYNRPPGANGVMDLTDFMIENEIFLLVTNPASSPSNFSLSFSGGD